MMSRSPLRILIAAAATLIAAPLAAQTAPPPPPEGESGRLVVDVVGGVTAPMPIAVPVMPTPVAADTPAGSTAALGRQVADVVAGDLRGSGLFTPIGPSGLPAVSYPQVQAPD